MTARQNTQAGIMAMNKGAVEEFGKGEMVDEMGLGLRDRLRLNYVNAECWIRGSDVVKIGVGWG